MNQHKGERDLSAVPDWRQELSSTPEPRPSLALLAGAVCGAAFLAWQWWLLPVLVDWRGSASQEGLVLAAAARLRAGDLPYRQFFLPGAPGAALLNALVGAGREGARATALLASCFSGVLTLRAAHAWKVPLGERGLLAALLAAWSFSLWNMAGGGWYAVPFTLLALSVLPRSVAAAGILFALAFWFSPALGGGGAIGASACLLLQRDRRAAALLAGVFAAAVLPLVALAGSQLFFPALPVGALPLEALAAPLTTLGLWMLSLFFLRSDSRSISARLVQLGVLAYGGIYAARAPVQFAQAGFVLLSLAAWPCSLALALSEKAGRARILAFWLPGFLALLLLGRAPEPARFLWLFPFSAPLLAYSLARMHARYAWLPPLWARLPALALLAGGIFLQAGVVNLRTSGARDSLGFVSAGTGQRLDEEVTAVWRELRAAGLKPGDPVLALPDVPSFYGWTGFTNPTPFLSYPPGASGLEGYEGRFLVLEDDGGLEASHPTLWGMVQARYQQRKSFPEHFTLYERR